MDPRAEKIAKARRKLKDHQEKKSNQDPINVQYEKRDGVKADSVIEDAHKLKKSELDDKNIVTKFDTISKETDRWADGNVNEYYIFNQNSLEQEIKLLHQTLSDLEVKYADEKANHNKAKQTIGCLESEISNLQNKLFILNQDLNKKNLVISEFTNNSAIQQNENINLSEQLELTKSILKSKEAENAHLHSQVNLYLNQLEVAQLQIQQLSSDNSVNIKSDNRKEEVQQLNLKIDSLTKKITSLQQEKDNIALHYQHYMNDLREQLNVCTLKNEELSREVDILSDRETGLIEQIGNLEIRMQKFNKKDFEIDTQIDTSEIQQTVVKLQENLAESRRQQEELQEKYNNSICKIIELEEIKKFHPDQDSISITKLTADMTSDKLAAQRATEQNFKLKTDIEELEQVVIKLTKDKLELTEMLTHEKNLTKELTLKVADFQENMVKLQNNLKAKDEEMIRLQSEFREIAKSYNNTIDFNVKQSSNNEINNISEIELPEPQETNNNDSTDSNILETNNEENTNDKPLENHCGIAKEDAMVKLQERFMRIMDEVANLSDEKHRLEHIILQLQNETDTICEYVALYQQQRSLLKKRDEERTHQLKTFEKECHELRTLLEDLRELLFRLAEDKEISTYLKTESRIIDMTKIKKLLEELRNSSLLTKQFKSTDYNTFYPCSCCSGKLIEV
ncbi:unnamed protein product [Leptosia nina]|uniref:Golgin subfamily A conserved domain-containing protein n=1 Tax=Leptosia nina TaxID=320188 RepID=A0AAV1JLV2_9NEOP